MRSPDAGSWRLLFGKERRELASSRAWLVLIVVVGPLVGCGFINALHSYPRVSDNGGGPETLAQGLGGIVAPTFGAYSIVVTLLLPLVAIRLVSSEKESGALKLLLQSRTSLGMMLVIKLLVLVLAWLLAWLPGLTALALWSSNGGELAAPGIAALLVGDLLRATRVCAIAIAAAAFTDSMVTAALITFPVTIGFWTLDFLARPGGAVALGLEAYTRELALRPLERGELRLSLVLTTLIMTMGALLLAWVWLPSHRTRRQRILFTLPITVIVALLLLGAGRFHQSWALDALASVTPAGEPVSAYAEYPLRTTARGAAVIFYLLWPLLVIGLWWLSRRRRVAQTS